MYHPKSPAGTLMWEHRLILRAVRDMQASAAELVAGEQLEPGYVDTVVDFLRTYADRCHHGKEEDILFRDLAERRLAPEHAEAMDGLLRDHVWARATTGRLVEAHERYTAGDAEALAEVARILGELADFYPVHIDKEDHGFFKPAFEYFSTDERSAMEERFDAFDMMLVHERYTGVVERLEARTGRPSGD